MWFMHFPTQIAGLPPLLAHTHNICVHGILKCGCLLKLYTVVGEKRMVVNNTDELRTSPKHYVNYKCCQHRNKASGCLV
jgi:hypothetical protein